MLLAVIAVLSIAVLDQLLTSRPWPIPVEGLLDEPAHLLTAALLVQAAAPRLPRSAVAGALAGSVLIDLDHVPLYLWPDSVGAGSGRPVTHSLGTVLLLTAVSLLVPARGRALLAGAGLGVLLHLFRDLASEPGVPLWWPFAPSGVQVPYAAYLAVLVAAGVVSVARTGRDRNELSRGTGG